MRLLKSLFSFSKSEKNGVLLLLSVIVLGVIIHQSVFYLSPSKRDYGMNFDAFKSQVDSFHRGIKSSAKWNGEPVHKSITINNPIEKQNYEAFDFDPNKISKDEMQKLGLAKSAISNLLKYRNSGGKFFDKFDLLKVYGLDSQTYQRLENHIVIERQIPGEKRIEKSTKPRVWISLDSSDHTTWSKIPGIGPVLSKRICNYRASLGGFYSHRQLQEVYGISDSLYLEILPYLDTTGQVFQKLDLNKADYKALIKHPYINKEITLGILNYRKERTKFNSSIELVHNGIVSDTLFKKLKHYIWVN